MGRPQNRPDPALAAAIRQVRHERELTQEDLAHAAGVTTTTLARIEGLAANPAWTTVNQIAQALGVTMGELGDLVDKLRRST